jgi:hypothetical protein
MTAPLAYFGINSSGLNLVIDLVILFLVVLYLSLIYWTYADARRRILDPMLVGCATAASLFPFVGTIVYMILRPPEYLEDVHERELETRAAEARLHELDYGLCPHCDYRIERDFLRCPSCLRKLKDRCASCSRPLDRAWTICPYCETEVAGAQTSRRTRRRASAGSSPGDGTTPEDERSEADRAERGGDPPPVEEQSLSPRGVVGTGRAPAPRGGRAPVPASEPEPPPRPRGGSGRASRPRPTS